MHLLKALTGTSLAREKLKDFNHVVAVQTALILTAMVVRDLPGLTGISPAMPWLESLFFAILGLYVWFLWDLLRNYIRNRPLLIGLLVLIMGTFVEGVVVANPFFTIVEGPVFRMLTDIIMCTLMLVELCVIVFTIREIVVRELPISEQLWGAVCIYLIIGIMFGSIYELVCIIELNSLPMELPLGRSHFIKVSATVSWCWAG